MNTLTASPPITAPSIPVASGSFLLGNVPAMRRDPLQAMYDIWREHGDLVEVALPGRKLYLVSHPDMIDPIFVEGKKRFIKPTAQAGMINLELVLGNGLVTNPHYDDWLPQRRMIQPMFHRRRIAQMGETMTAAADDMLARWQAKYAPGDVIDLDVEMTAVTPDIINRTMFSADGADKMAGQVGTAVGVAAEFVFRRSQRLLNPPLNWPTPANREFHRVNAEMEQIIDDIITQRRESGEERGDLLDMLLAARDEETGAGMSEQQLRDEVKTIFAAGHETTSNALTWAWYLLAQHPAVLRRLQAEVDEVLDGRTPTLADLPRLPYTRRVFDETLRLYTPVPLIARHLPQEAPLLDYTLPGNSMIAVSIYNIHRHPDFWDDPETFDPDRFAPERSAGRRKYAYMPFGAGPRKCIGNHFALTEGTLLLAAIASRYNLRLVPDHPVERQVAITMRPKYGMKMIVESR
ncbi:MAG: cytochrome P450 [Bacteroidetes bacterium]|nr:MAG: cytochrome P450 [Bacteroidota bacterium]